MTVLLLIVCAGISFRWWECIAWWLYTICVCVCGCVCVCVCWLSCTQADQMAHVLPSPSHTSCDLAAGNPCNDYQHWVVWCELNIETRHNVCCTKDRTTSAWAGMKVNPSTWWNMVLALYLEQALLHVKKEYIRTAFTVQVFTEAKWELFLVWEFTRKIHVSLPVKQILITV